MAGRRWTPDRVLKVLAFPLLLGLVILFGVLNRDTLFALFSDPEGLAARLTELGWRAPFFYILAQILQVFVFIVPGDVVQFAGGYLFGLWGGLGLSLVGIGLGSTINFFLARWLGRSFVEGLFSQDQVDQFERFLGAPRARLGFFLLFAIPGLPGKDLLCYVAGISTLRFPTFLAITLGARIPGILGSSIMGSSVSSGQYTLAIVVFSAALVLFAAGFILRKQIRAWVEKRASHSTPGVDSVGAGSGESVGSESGDASVPDSAADSVSGAPGDSKPGDSGLENSRR